MKREKSITENENHIFYDLIEAVSLIMSILDVTAWLHSLFPTYMETILLAGKWENTPLSLPMPTSFSKKSCLCESH